jgi:hypothetical protein
MTSLFLFVSATTNHGRTAGAWRATMNHAASVFWICWLERSARLVALVILVALVGCRHSPDDKDAATPKPPPPITFAFERLTAEQPPPTGSPAMVAYRGDTGALDAAGGRPIGELTVNVPATLNDDEADAEAVTEAAKRGGTHILRIGRADASEKTLDEDATRKKRFWWALSGFNDEENCRRGNMNACRHQLEPAPKVYRTLARHVVKYLIVAVPTDRWQELSPALRPMPP